jgi:hypothetical protein
VASGPKLPGKIVVGESQPIQGSRIIKTHFEIIHKGLVGNHSSRNFMMRVVKIAPSRSSSRLGVSQGLKMTSFGCESRG